jgi:hypothetical protein
MDDDVYFYIHVDKKSDQKPFAQAFSEFKCIHFVQEQNRIAVSWGEVSMVQATLELMKLAALNHKSGYSVLLSNSDYPIKSNSQIRKYFSQNYGDVFASLNEMSAGMDEYFNRIQSYCFRFSCKKYDFMLVPSIWSPNFYRKKVIRGIIRNFKLSRIYFLSRILIPRSHPKGIKPMWGGQWWAMPNEVLNEVLQYMTSNKALFRFHRFTLIPDEIYIQTVLHHLSIKGNIKTNFNIRLTFMKFQHRSPSPMVLTLEDKLELFSLPDRFLFARKFDSRIDKTIIDHIDSYRLENTL